MIEYNAVLDQKVQMGRASAVPVIPVGRDSQEGSALMGRVGFASRVALGLALVKGMVASVMAQSTTTPVDTSALTTGLTTVTTIFNTVAGIVAAAVLFFVGVKVFKWIRK
ncbi:MAG: hypothetical protein ACYDH9_18575 [Limisphaerales bacterium]